MHCVYQAFKDHLDYIGITPSRNTLWHIYSSRKELYHDSLNEPTSGAVIPAIAHRLCWGINRHFESVCRVDLDLDLRIVMQYRIWTPELYLADAKTERQKNFVNSMGMWYGGFGQEVDQITLQPAIYLSLSNQHAFFGTGVPTRGVIVMAVQFYSPTKNLYTPWRKILWQIRTLKSMLAHSSR